ncbi:MAG: HAD family phosphatase [Actinobacteria bacterium]|nr:HAD family phosphatase [Actinomycetota bacterium]
MTALQRSDSAIEAIVFDMDGVIVESEHLWDQVRRRLAADYGQEWPAEATRAMQGMSTPEWARYLREDVGIDVPAQQLADEVLSRMADTYSANLPLIPGAVQTVRLLAQHWPLGLASSSSRSLIDVVLATAGIADSFAVTVSTEEVTAGKPSPVVYQRATELLSVNPALTVGIEDSSNGMRSVKAAGMLLIGIPNRDYPPEEQALLLADSVVRDIGEVTPGLVLSLV